MGDAKAGPVRLSFNPYLRVEFRDATVTPDAGLLLPRELDERLGLSALIERRDGTVCSVDPAMAAELGPYRESRVKRAAKTP